MNLEPEFLTLQDVFSVHEDQIKRYGGSPGLRDEGMLQSAISMPMSGSGGEYFHKSIHEMAAAYLFHLVQNHPFVDGNKRVGAASALVFLYLNGIELTADEDEFEKMVMDVASGKMEKSAVVQFVEKNSQPSN